MNNPASYIPAFRGRKVLVVGDAILDIYEKGTTDKLCREAPVPVVNIYERTFSCGGASNTAANIAALGGDVKFLGVLGTDPEGDRLLGDLEATGVDTRSALRIKQRRTITKTRVCVSSNILVRVDEGDVSAISHNSANDLAKSFRRELEACEVVVISDYDYGMFSEYLLRKLCAICAKGAPPVVVDAKHPEKFRGLAPAAVKPNYEESVNVLGISPLSRGPRVEQILAHGNKLLERTGAGFVATTLDMDGTILFERGSRPYLVSCVPQADKQTVGAGDSFIGGLSLAVAAGAPPKSAVRLAAAAAAVVIKKDGTGVCTSDDLLAHFHGHSKRVASNEAMARIVREMKARNRRVVFTNGCFDILHRGHVEFLHQARALGDTLIVALNSDASIHRLKGAGRPVNSLEDRMEVLAALQAVDFLLCFDGESPVGLLEMLRPDIFAKGGTYSVDSLPEAELVRELGGEVEIIPFHSHLSTSRLIHKIQHPAGPPSSTRNDQRAL